MPIKVYVVDDSAIVRQTVQHLLRDDPTFELIGSAPNPLLATPALRNNRPDVLLLDIEMPGMDGLTFLRQIMSTNPIPTVICSTLTTKGGEMAAEAMAAGAVAVITKPRLGLKNFLENSRREMAQALKAAAQARPRRTTATAAAVASTAGKPAKTAGLHALATNKPVVIGSSTGGVQAIETVLSGLPKDCPGIAIVQHMPENFTGPCAKRLDMVCAVTVREARDGDRLERGTVLLAPGGRHMQLRKTHGQYFVNVFDGPPVNRHKPSVDVLFRSAAECAGADALALILTGMGNDGARGMEQMHDAGARTIAQNEETCIVFGMPKEAIALGAVDEVLPLSGMSQAIVRFDARG